MFICRGLFQAGSRVLSCSLITGCRGKDGCYPHGLTEVTFKNDTRLRPRPLPGPVRRSTCREVISFWIRLPAPNGGVGEGGTGENFFRAVGGHRQRQHSKKSGGAFKKIPPCVFLLSAFICTHFFGRNVTSWTVNDRFSLLQSL